MVERGRGRRMSCGGITQLVGVMLLAVCLAGSAQTAAPDSADSHEVTIQIEGRGFTVWITDPRGKVTRSSWDGADISNGIPDCYVDPSYAISPPDEPEEENWFPASFTLMWPKSGTYRLRVQAVEDCSLVLGVCKRDGGCCASEKAKLQKGAVRSWTLRWNAPRQDTCWVVLKPVSTPGRSRPFVK
jgi:hypothetical protein